MSRIPVPLFVVLLAACGGDGDDPVVAGGGTASLLAPVDAPVESGGDGGNASRDDVVVSGNDRTTFRDEETGSVWTLTGLAIDGPLAGAQLQQLPAYSAYWFAWSSFWPNTDVWGQQDGSGEYAESAFQPIESGFVPDVPIDAIPPLDDPFAGFGWALFEPAEDSGLRDADIVVGVEVDGDARAYPVQILNFHEIVNHTVGDRELIVTYCPLTASGIAFEGGETFGNTGGLFNNNMVMYDRTSRSFWSQMGLSVIRTDNGAPFCSKAIHGLSHLNVWWLRLGIQHQRIRPASPQENGAHERMHRTLKRTACRPVRANRTAQQRAFDHFREEFNDERPHEAIDDEPPGSRYQTSSRPYTEKLPTIEYPGHFTVKRVTHQGTIRFRHKLFFLSRTLDTLPIGLEETDDGIWALYFQELLLAKIDERTMKLSF